MEILLSFTHPHHAFVNQFEFLSSME